MTPNPTINSINTPGIYYAFSYCVVSFYIAMLGERKRPIWLMTIYQLVYFCILGAIMFYTSESRIFFIPLTIMYMTSIYLSLRFNCYYEPKVTLYLALHTFILAELWASTHWMIYFFAVNFFGYTDKHIGKIIMLMLVYAILGRCFWFEEKKMVNHRKNMNIGIKELGAVLIMTIAVYGLSNVYYLAGKTLFGGYYASEIFVIRTLVDLGGMAIMYAFEIQMGDLSTRLEMERLQDALEMQRTNYKMLSQSMELVNIKYHDLKHQIAIIREGINNQSSLEYLDKMEQEIKIYEAQNKTGNEVLDTILTAKSIHCQNNWIEMTVVADGEALSFMEPMDISALFGNMLDNAIESVEKIDQKEKRLIHLAVAHQKGFVRIRLENCYKDKPRIVNGQIKTSKSDSRYHGFGIKSIESIVKKYGGSLTMRAEDGWFEQRILIPTKRITS
ncbi:MAG: GHKL domain-containing protein [Butyrivibrio sp.]|nr:GHKL domain-containing protein [Butyrivibrio sp.]